MENENLEPMEQTPPEPGYVPRPAWQVWLARVSLVVFILILIAFYLNMFRGA